MAEANLTPEIIASTGLVPVSVGAWREISYIWADQLYGDPPRVLAKYLFTYHVTAAQWHQWNEWGDRFVSEVIEPIYFRLANDISWNIYWVSVLSEEELRKINPQQRIVFTSNTEYTRNLLLSLEHLSESIPIGRISVDITGREMEQPSDDWTAQLEGKGLSFCLDEYAKKNLDAYLEGKTESQKSTISSIDAVAGQHLTKLRSIFIPQKFRAHCYPKDWSIPFRNVNLLYGLNGSGKTSLLSAIELAMTGDVRSLMEDAAQAESIQAKPVLSVEVDERSVVLAPPLKPAEKKERERQFYRSRNANRTSSQLQSLFHRFNYLSAEETFLFTSNQPNLTKIFSQILFGPETQEMWRNLGRYKNVCTEMAANYEQELESLKEQTEALAEVPAADWDSFWAYLVASDLNFGQDAAPEEILTETQRILAEYDKVKSLGPIPSIERLTEEQTVQKKRFHELLAEIENLTAALTPVEDKELTLTQEIEKCMGVRSATEQVVTSLCVLVPLAKQLQFYKDYRDWFEDYQSCLKQQKAFESTANQLRALKEDYEFVLDSPVAATPQQLREQARQMQQQRSSLQIQLDALDVQIDQKELAQEKRTTLFSALSSAGLEIYQLDESRRTCPLCGTEGITDKILREHLQRESALGDQQLQALYQKRQKVRDQLETTKSTLKTLNQREIVAQTYQEALQAIHQNFPEIQSADDLRQAFIDAQENHATKKNETEKLKGYLLKELEKASVIGTIEEICKSRQNLLKSVPPQYTEHFKPGASDEALTTEFFSLLQYYEKNQAELDTNICQKKAALEQLREALKRLRQKRSQMEEQSETLKENILRLEKISDFWKSVRGTATNPSLSGEAVHALCENLHHQAYRIIEFTENKSQKEHYQKKAADIQERLNRCHILQATLESLRSPDSYADAFICQNVAQISRIFLALHSPQEFSGLDIVDRQLVAFRNGKEVSINRMSTGQRTALVISVFFQMNLATPLVPSFLLLDEPVANIDDLNVLALMDLLREIAVTHRRQIFFTTANQNVAKLFRRKFSFLESDFQELRFFREEEHCLRITKRVYDQTRLQESVEL